MIIKNPDKHLTYQGTKKQYDTGCKHNQKTVAASLRILVAYSGNILLKFKTTLPSIVSSQSQ